jgi:hypothetical protein
MYIKRKKNYNHFSYLNILKDIKRQNRQNSDACMCKVSSICDKSCIEQKVVLLSCMHQPVQPKSLSY